MVVVSMRAYLSAQHLWAARHFVRLAKEREQALTEPRLDMPHRAYVIQGVLSSIAFIESVVNELFQDCADGHTGHIGDLSDRLIAALRSYWLETNGRGRTLEKIQVALIAAGNEPLRTDESPYQDLSLLIKLQNRLIHFEPESVTLGTEKKFDRQFKGKFDTNPFFEGAGNAYFPDHCLSAGCAEWSVNTVLVVADALARDVGFKPTYQQLDWSAVDPA